MPDSLFVELYAALHDTLPDEHAAAPTPSRTPTAMPGLSVKEPDAARGWKLAEGHTFDESVVENMRRRAQRKGYILDVKPMRFRDGRTRHQITVYHPKGQRMANPTEFYSADEGEGTASDQPAPIVAYHGSKSRISEFDPKMIGQTDRGMYGHGFSFTTDPKGARAYGPHVHEAELDIKNPVKIGPLWGQDKHADTMWRFLRDHLGEQAANTLPQSEWPKAMQQLGHDGVAVKDHHQIEYLAFHPHQIKIRGIQSDHDQEPDQYAARHIPSSPGQRGLFDQDQHPRGQPENAGEFKKKEAAAPVSRVSDAPPVGNVSDAPPVEPRLERGSVGTSGLPPTGTLDEITAAAKRKFGKKYQGLYLKSYGGGTQFEVRRTKDGYHGRESVLVATYPVPADQVPQWKARFEKAKAPQAAPDPDTTGQNPDTPQLQNVGTSQQVPTNPDTGTPGDTPREWWQVPLKEYAREMHERTRPLTKSGKSWDQWLADGVPEQDLIHLSGAGHEVYVKDAIERGLPVPPEVLADYPDLQKQGEIRKPAPAPETPTSAQVSAKADPFGTGAGQKFKPTNMPDIVSRDFAYHIQNDVPVPEGGKLVASSIVQRSVRGHHPLFRLSVVENQDGTRYVLTENGRDTHGSLAGAETAFHRLDDRTLQSKALAGINRLSDQLWEKHKPGRSAEPGLFSAALTSALLREYYAQRFADRVVERYAAKQTQDQHGRYMPDDVHGKIYTPETQDEFDHLPVGVKYLDPDSGHVHDKRQWPPVHRGPSEHATATLGAMRARLGKGYRAYLKQEGIEDDHESVAEYLESQHGITVRDDGRVEFDRLDKPTSHIVADLPVVVHHHTSDALHPSIKQHGLLPAGDGRKPTNPHLNSKAGVYVTTESSGPAVAGYHGIATHKHGGNPRTYEVESKIADLTPDPDDQDLPSLANRQFILPHVPPHKILNLDAEKYSASQGRLFDDVGGAPRKEFDETKHQRAGGQFARKFPRVQSKEVQPALPGVEMPAQRRIVTKKQPVGQNTTAMHNAKTPETVQPAAAPPNREEQLQAAGLEMRSMWDQHMQLPRSTRHRALTDLQHSTHQMLESRFGESLSRQDATTLLNHVFGDELPFDAEDIVAKPHYQKRGNYDPAGLMLDAHHRLWENERERRRSEAVERAGDAKAMKFAKPNSDVHFVVHPAAHADYQGQWQITRFDDRGPSGHQYHKTKEEAIGAAIGAHPNSYWDEGDSDYRLVEQYTEDKARLDLYTALWCAQQGLDRYAVRSDPRQTSLFGFGETGQGAAVKPRAVGHMGENLAPPTSAILPPHHQARHAALLAKGFRRTPAEQQEFQDLGRRIEELQDRRQPVTREHYTDAPAHWQHDPTPPTDESQYTGADEHHKKLWEFYKGKGTSSRTTPSELPNPPVGSWRMDKHFGIYGREIEQLRMVPVHELTLSEGDYTDPKVNDEGRGDDARRYAGWMKEHGLEHLPPIHVVETDQGTHRVMNGHRRTAAAKLAGMTHIPAWVSPRMKTGKKYYGQDLDIGTGLTYEGARHGAEAASKMYEERQRKLSDSIRAERAAKENAPVPESYSQQLRDAILDRYHAQQPERYKYTPPAVPRFEPADLEHYLDVRRRSGETRIPRKGETPENNASYRLSERHERDIRRRVWPRTNVHLVDVPISMLQIREGDLAPERQARLKSIQGTDDPVMAHIDHGGKNEIVLNVDDGNNRVAWHREQGHATVPAFLHEHDPGDMEQVRQMIAPHHAKLQRATYRQSIQQAFLDRYRDLTAQSEQAPPTTGEPIHHTRTPQFKRFFGDWEAEPHNASKVRHPEGHPKETHEIPGTGSKVRGQDGKPIVVYHGTSRGGFDRFDPNKQEEMSAYGPGFYFTEDKDVADSYQGKDSAEWEFKTTGETDQAKRLAAGKALRAHLAKTVSSGQTEGSGRFPGETERVMEFLRERNDEQLGKALESPGLREWVNVYAPTDHLYGPRDSVNHETKAVYLNIRKPFDADKDHVPIGHLPKEIAGMLMDKHGRQQAAATVSSMQKLLNQSMQDKDQQMTTYWQGELARSQKKLAEIENGRVNHQYLQQYMSPKMVNQTLQSLGYDGITHVGGDRMGGGHHHRVWIAFKPHQIKSVTNRGTWDPEDERMDYEQDQNPVAREPYAQFQDLVALAGLDRYKAKDSPGQRHLFKEEDHPRAPEGAKGGHGGEFVAKKADYPVSPEVSKSRGEDDAAHREAKSRELDRPRDELQRLRADRERRKAHNAAMLPTEEQFRQALEAIQGRTTKPTHDEPAARGDNEELVARVQSGDKAAFDQLLASNRPFIADRARKAGAREGRDLEDWIQEGSVILWQAAAKFDATQGNKFTTYLGTAIDRRFWKLRKKEIGTKEKPRPRHLQGAVDDEGRPVHEPVASPDEAPLADQELKQAVRTVVKKIPNPRHQQIVKLAFGLDGPPLTHAQIAEQLGVKPQAVQQQLARILPTLQRQLQDQYAARCLRDAVLERYHAIMRGTPERYAKAKAPDLAPRGAENSKSVTSGSPDHTETPEFKKWFGESHVRHPETGKPLVLYHGTSEDIDAFDRTHHNRRDTGWLGAGHYLTTSQDTASGYALTKGGKAGANVMPVYASIQNPFHWGLKTLGVRGETTRGFGLPKDVRDEVLRRTGHKFDPMREPDFASEPLLSEALRQVLIERGHDGVIADTGDGHQEIVAFHPHQIKSATGNRGTYSKADPRINYTQAFQDAYRDRYGLRDLAGAALTKAADWVKGTKSNEPAEHEPHAHPNRPEQPTRTERRAGPPAAKTPVEAEIVRPAAKPPEPSPAAKAKQQAAAKPLHPRGIGAPMLFDDVAVRRFHTPNLQAAHEALSKLHDKNHVPDEAKRITDARVRARTVNIRNDQQQYRDLFAQQINPTREAVHARLKQQADQALAGAQREYDQRAAMLRSAHEAARQHRETALRYPEGHPAREKMLAEVQEAQGNIRRHAESLQGLHNEVNRLHATAPEKPEPWKGWGTGESKKPVSDQERKARAQERDARKQAGQQVKWLQYRGVEVPKGDPQDPEYRRQVAAMHEQETARYLEEHKQLRARREQRLQGQPQAAKTVRPGDPQAPPDPLGAANKAVRDFQDPSQHELLAGTIALRIVNDQIKAAGGAPLRSPAQLRKFPGYATHYKRAQQQAHDYLEGQSRQAIDAAEQAGADPQEIQQMREAHAGKAKLRVREHGFEGAQATAELTDEQGNKLTPEQVRARKAAQTRATNATAKAERVEKINTPEVPHPQDLPTHQDELPEEMRKFGWKPPANVTAAQHLLIQSLYGLHGTPQRSFHDLVNETVRRQAGAGPDGPVREADQQRVAGQLAEQVRDAIGKTRTASAAAAYGMEPREYHQIADQAMHDEVNRATKHNALFDRLSSAKQQAQLAAGDDHETVLRGFDTLAYPTLQEAEVPGLTEGNAMQKAQEILERGRVPVPGPHTDEWHQAVVDQLGQPPEPGQDDEQPPPDDEEPVPFQARRATDLRAELYSALWWATTGA